MKDLYIESMECERNGKWYEGQRQGQIQDETRIKFKSFPLRLYLPCQPCGKRKQLIQINWSSAYKDGLLSFSPETFHKLKYSFTNSSCFIHPSGSRSMAWHSRISEHLLQLMLVQMYLASYISYIRWNMKWITRNLKQYINLVVRKKYVLCIKMP